MTNKELFRLWEEFRAEAVEQAVEWFGERKPSIVVEELK